MRIDAMEMLNHAACDLGEGPTYDPHTDTAWWFDITGRALYEYRFETGKAHKHDLPMAASALARVDKTRQVMVTETGLFLRDVADGTLRMLQPVEADRPETRSNDARVHPCGAIWLSTMGWEAQPGAGTIYHYRAGVLTPLFENITIPNAICFSPDGSVGYFADTALGIVNRVALDPATGLPMARPTIWRDSFDGGPDGAIVDAGGSVLIAIWGGSAVVRYDISGQEQSRITLPVSQPSCPAFVGHGADRLLITTARHGLKSPGDGDGRCYMAALETPGQHAPDLVI